MINTVLVWVGAFALGAVLVVALYAIYVGLFVDRGVKYAPEPAKEAMPVDPVNPPSWKVYSPKQGAPGRSCACHPDVALVPGQKVLWWPVPNSGGGVNVFCEDGVEQDQ